MTQENHSDASRVTHSILQHAAIDAIRESFDIQELLRARKRKWAGVGFGMIALFCLVLGLSPWPWTKTQLDAAICFFFALVLLILGVVMVSQAARIERGAQRFLERTLDQDQRNHSPIRRVK